MGRRTPACNAPHHAMLSEVEVQLHRRGSWNPSPEWLAAMDRAMGPQGFIGSPRAIFGTPEALLGQWAEERGFTRTQEGGVVMPGWEPLPVAPVAVQWGLFGE